MANCRRCGTEMSGQAIKCPECGEVHIGDNSPQDDKGSFLYVIVGLCVPIIGVILFFAWNKNKPKSARNALIGALISLPIIVVMGIISAFAIPAVGQILINTQASSIYADALAVESAAELYCIQNDCEIGTDIQYGDISMYIEGIDVDYYELSSDTDVAYYALDGMHVHLEAKGIGNLEFHEGMIPSQSTVDDVVEDTN